MPLPNMGFSGCVSGIGQRRRLTSAGALLAAHSFVSPIRGALPPGSRAAPCGRQRRVSWRPAYATMAQRVLPGRIASCDFERPAGPSHTISAPVSGVQECARASAPESKDDVVRSGAGARRMHPLGGEAPSREGHRPLRHRATGRPAGGARLGRVPGGRWCCWRGRATARTSSTNWHRS